MEPTDDAVHHRAKLLPEEIAVGSADPDAQAAAILRESEERVAAPTAAPGAAQPDPDEPTPVDDDYEHRRSEDTV